MDYNYVQHTKARINIHPSVVQGTGTAPQIWVWSLQMNLL